MPSMGYMTIPSPRRSSPNLLEELRVVEALDEDAAGPGHWAGISGVATDPDAAPWRAVLGRGSLGHEGHPMTVDRELAATLRTTRSRPAVSWSDTVVSLQSTTTASTPESSSTVRPRTAPTLG